ncbi:MAG: peptidyl-prolyl cis-trans isomerase, partial [Deltaproteobacteria bacterium]|nr:peptidyl-prolyl cis-trans isomerase [Deltaproteobacteria bacterium]
TWRALLRYTMAMLRFNDQVLRPKVRLAEDEVEKYYAAHAAEFLEPSRLSLLVLTGSSQKAVAEARDRVLAGRENENRHDAPDVQSQRVAIRPAALPEIWQEEMDRLAEGKATRIREANDLFQCLILEKRNPARRLTPVEAYLRIEQVLIERSMEELFAEWLEAAMAGADISVVAQLLPRGGSTDEAVPEQDADPRNSEPILGAPDEEAEDDMADVPLSPAPDGANGEGAQEKAPE